MGRHFRRDQRRARSRPHLCHALQRSADGVRGVRARRGFSFSRKASRHLCRNATRRHPFEQIAFLQTITAATLMFFSVPVIEHAHMEFRPRLIAAVVVTGLLGTAAAFTVQAWAQQFMAATNTALIFALEPVFAWIT